MDEKERQSAFMSALTTEHFVLQTASSTTVSESAAYQKWRFRMFELTASKE